jgi:hypothetical protein
MLLCFLPLVTLASDTINHRARPAAKPIVHDHRTPPPRSAPKTIIVDHRRTPPPRSAQKPNDHCAQVGYPSFPPPAPRYKNPKARSGYIWNRGHYEWKGNKGNDYVWKGGHWARARADNAVWVPGSWAQAMRTPWVFTPGHYTGVTSKVKVRRR